MTGKEIRIISLLVLDTVFFLLEAIIGYTVHSLALIADSFHMLNDIVSLVIALWAVRVKNTKPADGKYTYGWQRAEIIGALINAVFLLALCFSIIIEAIQRIFDPQVISNPKLILVVGTAGLVSNGVGLVLFHEHGHSHGHGHSHSVSTEEENVGHGHEHSHVPVEENSSSNSISEYLPDNFVGRYDERSSLVPNKKEQPKQKKRSMNMEGVFLHVLGDALGNIGVIITALFIWKTDYSWKYYCDPLVSLLITAIIFSSALPLCRKSCKILLQATPANVNPNEIVEEITLIPGIKSLHDFHIWNLNEDFLIASVHIELNSSEPNDSGDGNEIINKVAFLEVVGLVRKVLHKYGIDSVTIQPEFASSLPGGLYGATNATSCGH